MRSFAQTLEFVVGDEVQQVPYIRYEGRNLIFRGAVLAEVQLILTALAAQ